MSVSPPDVTLTAPDERGRDDDALQPGTRVGRYRIDRPLGAGGQGVVLLATDPELDRKVAIKLLHSRAPRLTTRLLREGRALARVEHPAVVRVFDVGEHGGRVFLAMEFFDGEDLASHWTSARLAPHARVATIVAAGRGLAAVHAAGLVHRDFKPKNVLVDRRGRVAVTDFGLVRTLDAASTDPNTQTDPRVRVGTPGYMAPEQLVRADVDARADQFAFCVALYEAWYGVRPFGGHDVAELIGAMVGRVARPPAGARKAPQWLRRVLERGLDADPQARFADMDELLAALDRRGGRVRGFVLAIAALVLVLAFVLLRPPTTTTSKPARVAAAVAAIESPGSAWTRARVQAAILPAHEVLVKGEAQRARDLATALVESAERDGDATLANAALVVRGRAEVAQGERALGRRTLETALAAARASGDDATVANAALELGDHDMNEGRLAHAEQWLREVDAAVIRGDLPLSTIAALELRHAVIASRRGELDVAESSYYLLLDLTGDAPEDDRFRASMLNNLAAIHRGTPSMITDFALALALYEAAGITTP
ncbi:MAG TPA: protein kinase, partial [Nannocystaceae bacterium]|nr:protein kinase [Nannocystaceae bacterium]